MTSSAVILTSPLTSPPSPRVKSAFSCQRIWKSRFALTLSFIWQPRFLTRASLLHPGIVAKKCIAGKRGGLGSIAAAAGSWRSLGDGSSERRSRDGTTVAGWNRRSDRCLPLRPRRSHAASRRTAPTHSSSRSLPTPSPRLASQQ